MSVRPPTCQVFEMTPCPLLNLQVSWDRKSTAAATAVSSRIVELRCFLRAVAMDWTGRSVAKSESQCMQYKAPHGASLREGRPPHAIPYDRTGLLRRCLSSPCPSHGPTGAIGFQMGVKRLCEMWRASRMMATDPMFRKVG